MGLDQCLTELENLINIMKRIVETTDKNTIIINLAEFDGNIDLIGGRINTLMNNPNAIDNSDNYSEKEKRLKIIITNLKSLGRTILQASDNNSSSLNDITLRLAPNKFEYSIINVLNELLKLYRKRQDQKQ